jgi:TrmH family RNA methyltransferase
VITSTANPRVKAALALRKRRERDRTGRFLIEGRRELARALAAGVMVEEVLACPALLGRAEGVTDQADAHEERGAAAAADPDMRGRAETAGDRGVPGHRGVLGSAEAAGARVVEVTEAVFARLSYRDNPDGVLGVARAFDTGLEALDLAGVADPLVLVVAELEKPGNLGAMLRSASAAGAAAVIVADPVTDVFNPNVVRSSQGALFGVPVGVGDTGAVLGWLRGHGLRVYAAGPGGSQPYWRLPLAGPCALVVGSEHRGLPAEWFDAADERVVIPMPGSAGVDSLNAAAAAAVLLFDAVRQRAATEG